LTQHLDAGLAGGLSVILLRDLEFDRLGRRVGQREGDAARAAAHQVDGNDLSGESALGDGDGERTSEHDLLAGVGDDGQDDADGRRAGGQICVTTDHHRHGLLCAGSEGDEAGRAVVVSVELHVEAGVRDRDAGGGIILENDIHRIDQAADDRRIRIERNRSHGQHEAAGHARRAAHGGDGVGAIFGAGVVRIGVRGGGDGNERRATDGNRGIIDEQVVAIDHTAGGGRPG